VACLGLCHQGALIQTLRFTVFHRAALLVRPGGALRLRLAANDATRQTYTRIRDALADVA